MTCLATRAVSSLTVDPGAILDVTSGQLTAGSLVDDGTIVVEGDPPTLVITGPATIGSTGSIEAVGAGSTVDFQGGTWLIIKASLPPVRAAPRPPQRRCHY